MLKKTHRALFAITITILTLIACGTDKGHFVIEGHLLNLNQGQFIVYSPDGAIEGIDTITINGGRFTYEPECQKEGMVLLIMPNGTEIPVFVEPGASISMDGNAQNLKEIAIKGLDENKQMDEFRKSIAGMAATRSNALPVKQVSDIIGKYPKSRVGYYLVKHYLMEATQPDYASAQRLLAILKKEQPDNLPLNVLAGVARDLQQTSKGSRLPVLELTDINGKRIPDSKLRKGYTVITAFGSWDFESIAQIRRLRDANRGKTDKLNIIALSLDASKHECRHSFTDTTDVTLLCDGMMTEGKTARRLVITQTSQALIIKDGNIISRTLSGNQLIDYMRSLP